MKRCWMPFSLGCLCFLCALLFPFRAAGGPADPGPEFLVSTATGKAYRALAAEDGSLVSMAQVESATWVGSGCNGIGLGDFDQDGITDYLIGGRLKTQPRPVIELHRGLGDGSFAPGTTVGPQNGWGSCTSVLVMDFAVADYNRDGWLDFAVNNYCGKKAHVFLGGGDGTFYEVFSWSMSFYAVGMDAEDLDGDGNMDFVAVSWDSSLRNPGLWIEVFLGDGAGGFDPYAYLLDSPYTSGNPAAVTRGIALDDFDFDGVADLVASCDRPSSSGYNLLSFYKGLGDGTFRAAPVVSGPATKGAGAYAQTQTVLAALDAEDLNGDGFPDVVAPQYYRPEVTLYLGQGDGTFVLSQSLAFDGSGAPPTGISTLPLQPANEPPVADAGGPYYGSTDEVLLDVRPDTFNRRANGRWVTAYIQADPEGDARILLDGAGSFDPDGDPLTYLWTVSDGEGLSFTLEGVQPYADLPPGLYTVELVVGDGQAASEPSSVLLQVDLLDEADLMAETLLLNGVPGSRASLEDSVLAVKFDRSAFGSTVEMGEQVAVVLTGSASGQDFIRVIDPGGHASRKR
ncbi:MAG: FG-GAP-like repeat-containing protein [bacterium]